MFLPATKVSSLPALILDVASPSALSSLVLSLAPRVAFQYELFTALATVVALTSFLPLSPFGALTEPVLLTVKSVVETSGTLAVNLPSFFTMVVPSTATSSS